MVEAFGDRPGRASRRGKILGRGQWPALAAIAGLLLVAGAVPGRAATPPPDAFAIDTWRPGVFASQHTDAWCVAASVQMMRNIIAGERDRSFESQRRYIRYAHAHDLQDQPGSDPAGWLAAVERFTGADYHITSRPKRWQALREAARGIMATGAPAGLIVAAGRHAWVMTGFTATADPTLDPTARVTGVWILGPLWPRPISATGYDPAPHTWIPVDKLKGLFRPMWDDDYVADFEGTYVAITPDANPAPARDLRRMD